LLLLAPMAWEAEVGNSILGHNWYCAIVYRPESVKLIFNYIFDRTRCGCSRPSTDIRSAPALFLEQCLDESHVASWRVLWFTRNSGIPCHFSPGHRYETLQLEIGSAHQYQSPRSVGNEI
jgi:hypothetical protein